MYRPVAARGSLMFFLLSELNKVRGRGRGRGRVSVSVLPTVRARQGARLPPVLASPPPPLPHQVHSFNQYSLNSFITVFETAVTGKRARPQWTGGTGNCLLDMILPKPKKKVTLTL